MNIQHANLAIAQAQRLLERVRGKNKSDCVEIDRVRELLASANQKLQPDEPVSFPAAVNDGMSAAQARRKERFW